MVEVFQATTAAIFITNFLLGAFLHDYFAGLGIFSLLWFAVFYTSDFTFAPPDVEIYYHIWGITLALVSNLAGCYYSIFWKLDPLITLQASKTYHTINQGTLGITFHILGLVLLAFGINTWLGRTELFNGGVFPWGIDLVHVGIGCTVAAIVLLVITTIVMATSDELEFKLSAKYVWIIVWAPVSMVIIDFHNYNWLWQLFMFVGLAIAWVITYFLAVYLPIGKKKDEDVFYYHKTYALYYFGGMALITILGLVILFAIVVWALPSSTLQTGMIFMMSWAGAVLIISAVASFIVSEDYVQTLIQSKPYSLELTSTGETYLNLNPQKKVLLTDRFQ